MDIRRDYLEQVRLQQEVGQLYPQFAGDVRKALTDFQEPAVDRRALDEIFEQQEYLRQTTPKVHTLLYVTFHNSSVLTILFVVSGAMGL